jgi:hypothetical protein
MLKLAIKNAMLFIAFAALLSFFCWITPGRDATAATFIMGIAFAGFIDFVISI